MSKEQIDEMAKDLCSLNRECESCPFTIRGIRCNPKRNAERAYSKGYRKQSDNVIELPCNIGDEIWYIDKKYTIQKAEATSISIRATSRHIIATRYVWEIEETIKLALRFEDINVDYWLTKEEAEESLAKMKGGAE